ncbi:peptidylprolyl isomerase [Gracilimonas mengyeensis]|uniref:peptidylprolyl isomerase n=1 Tax=Gracilimonas mengyeensis TaxID=1302730 RepID=A0A521AJX1_9BACT|nr:peptidylprolyl isomerase [Gracilimonas mengyeensis]SMO35125.1 PPIC-type PPIASE domain-containing protein [Gracilimonas mengyeensis]
MNHPFFHIISLFAGGLLLFTACNTPQRNGTDILAEVGMESLTLSEARQQIPPAILQSDSVSAIEQYRDKWVRQRVILQEADRLNFSSRPEVQKRLERLEEELIVQSVQDFIIGEFEDEVEVTDQEARNYYQQHKDEFTLEEQYVRYRHLVASSASDAENARQGLLQGQEWEDVANRYSLYPDLKIRESQKYWPLSLAGGDIESLNRYLRVIGPSEISPILQAGNEYHFVQLLDERPAGDHPDLDWLLEQIKGWLVMEKRKRAFNTYVKNLYLQGQANNEIKIYSVTNSDSTVQTDTASLNQSTNEE